MKMFRFVLILTFIGSGISVLSMILWPLMAPTMREMMANGEYAAFPGMDEAMMADTKGAIEQFLAIPAYYFIIMALLYALSLAGAIYMWRLKMRGFHLYTVAQLLLIVVPVLLLGRSFFDLGNAMMSALFIIYYYFTLRMLTADTVSEPAPYSDAPNQDSSDGDDDDGDDDDDDDDE